MIIVNADLKNVIYSQKLYENRILRNKIQNKSLISLKNVLYWNYIQLFI